MFYTSIISKVLYHTLIVSGGIVEKQFSKDTKNASNVNVKVLFKILNKNSNTEIGKKYNFEDIQSIKDYKEKVPLCDYSDFSEYIDRMSKGEKNILVKEDIEYFGHTSGTTGKQKLLPVTKSGRKIAAKYMALLSQKFCYNYFKSDLNYEKGLMIADVITTTYTEGGIPICSATSGGMKSLKNLIPYMYTSPYEVMLIKDKDSALYLHLLFALTYKDLQYISSAFIANILDLLRLLESHKSMLILDVRKGTINRKLNIDDTIRTKLNSYLKPNAGRADELELEFSKGFQGICKRIWPNLLYLACVTGATFSIYDEMVNYYTGYLPIYSTAYAATEGTFAINPYVNHIKYVIIPDTVFYEFIPLDEGNVDKTYCINELKIGDKYEIVVTNFSGLYRYKMGDVIKVVGFFNDSPEVEFLYRKNQVLNMVSEKTTEEHLKYSIENTMKQLSLDLIDYTTISDNSVSPGRYTFYIEVKNNASCSPKLIEHHLDIELQKANLAYSRFRSGNRLSSPKVILVKKGTFKNIKMFLLSKGISNNQIKIPRVITSNKDILNIIKSSIYK